MTIPIRTFLSLVALAGLVALGQTTSFEAKDWKQMATVTVEGGDRYGVLRLEAGTWRATEASLRDLRLRDANGSEIPYVLRDRGEIGSELAELRPLLYDRVVTPRGDLQFVLDFGESAPLHNMMRLRWSDRNFRRRMRIESSEAGKTWDAVKETVLLDFENEGQVFRTEDVEYPATSRRYMRVLIEDWKDAGALVSLVAFHRPTPKDEWVDLGTVQFTASKEAEPSGMQSIDVTLPFAAPEHMRLRFEIADGEFVRGAELKAELPGQRWVTACSGTIARAGDTDQPWVECNVVLARKLRVAFRNGDSGNLTIRAVKVLAPQREMIFPLKARRPYRLYAGNEMARTPVYDLSAVLRAAPAIDPQPANLSAWQRNPLYEAPGNPASEKARGWLTALLVAILIGIVLTAWFLLRMATRRHRRYV